MITIEPELLKKIDQGEPLRNYDNTYWEREARDSKDRAYGPCIARMAEALHYVQIRVNTFVDIGTGPGYFLDAIDVYLPNSSSTFFGIEKFPPPAHLRCKSERYIVGSLADLNRIADCGLCMEVIEHITPTMFVGLLTELARVSNSGALYIFNSGQPAFIRNEDSNYLDPIGRGHIVSYSVDAVRLLANPLGFVVHSLPGKTWAMVLEFAPKHQLKDLPLADRIWQALPGNLALLKDFAGGSAFRILGLESARSC